MEDREIKEENMVGKQHFERTEAMMTPRMSPALTRRKPIHRNGHLYCRQLCQCQFQPNNRIERANDAAKWVDVTKSFGFLHFSMSS